MRCAPSCLAAILALLLAAPAAHAADADTATATLENGLRVVVIPDHLAPVVSTQLVYLVGSNDAPPGFPGTAHALEHMMFRGSDTLDRDQLAEVGGQLGGNYNANTSQTVTQYTYTVPASDLGLVMRIEAGRMRGALMTADDWSHERGAIEQEVSRDLSNPAFVRWIEVQKALFKGSVYEETALGTRPSFDKTDAAMLRAFYDTWYAPNNAILVIAGDVDPAAAIAQARVVFGLVARRPVPAHAKLTLPPLEPSLIELPTSAGNGTLTLAMRFPGFLDKDFFAADILGDVLASERGTLFALGENGTALSSGFGVSAYPGASIGLAAAEFPAGADPAPILAAMKSVLANIAAGDIPPALVDAAKQAEVAQLAFSADSISGLAQLYARAVAQQGVTSPDDLARAYQNVSLDDVKRVAAKLLGAPSVTVIETPGGPRKPVTTATFGAPESFAAVPDHAVTLPAWATSALADLPADVSAPAPVATILPNGLRLLVQPEHVSATVSVYGRVREVGDIEEPPGQDGVSQITARLFGFGTTTHDRIAFRAAVDALAATAQAGPSFSLKVLAPRFAEGMALLAENELHPAFPPEAFAIVRAQASTALVGALRSPGVKAALAQRAGLAPKGDPSLRHPTPETVTALTLDDVRAYHARAYRPDLTTIVVVGDTTPEAALKIVTDTFGGWTADGPLPNIDLPPLGANPASTARIPDPGSTQDAVTLSQTLDVPVDSLDRYRLNLGNTVLGSGFSSRLYQDLRVRTGYVYSVSSSPIWSRTRASYTVSFGADPDKAAAARDLVVQNFRTMQNTSLSDADLTRAKAQVLRQLAMGSASVPAIAGGYLRLIELGLPLDTAERAPARYKGITAAEIQQAFTKFVRPDELLQVTRGPPVQ